MSSADSPTIARLASKARITEGRPPRRFSLAAAIGTPDNPPSRHHGDGPHPGATARAGSPHGAREETLRAHGFTVRLLARIMRAGFATANPEIVKAGGRTLSMLRLTITDNRAGRRSPACSGPRAAYALLMHGSPAINGYCSFRVHILRFAIGWTCSSTRPPTFAPHPRPPARSGASPSSRTSQPNTPKAPARPVRKGQGPARNPRDHHPSRTIAGKPFPLVNHVGVHDTLRVQ
jgi:hypothetical protein